MSLSKSLLFFSVLASTFASPLLSLESRAAECYPQNMATDVTDGNCPHKNTLDKSGNCQNIPGIPGNAGCTSYCELTLSKGFGQEVPFAQGWCQGGTTCGVALAQSVTTTQTWTISIGSGMSSTADLSKLLTSTFNIGASYSISKSLSYTTTVSHSKDLAAGVCGYWTFVPYVMNSCGTLTEVATKEMAAGYYDTDEVSYCDTRGAKTNTPNWCNKSIYKDDKGKADGEVLFVYVDCNSGAVLSNSQITGDTQPAAYLYPGVSTGPSAQ
ncbi:hypothetical protein G7Y89_g2254 [Cudoniella acicularis]|uniref:Uncharacterized protein n=1 Tax=Cudoniella acicularis TaxID=354080 RepID=A0A8H4RVI8_9HELO|nr:hypothetical protein G7Y89_g2254 [Cudoniella acicularis]